MQQAPVTVPSGMDFGLPAKKAMAQQLKPGDQLDHEGRKWTITEVGEDNEGQVVFHLKHGDELSVIKESDLPKELNIKQKQRT